MKRTIEYATCLTSFAVSLTRFGLFYAVNDLCEKTQTLAIWIFEHYGNGNTL
jgi:hypothetical protein